ncbi:hypothetical protein Fcan01_19286 [Folsomia candida]|uniref:Uncharacterized protein n=1 Tax=Folsomia candida TaxID=158441 RepID=A0A226DPR5_FOLCA|nr:hypothetical protein Fcan01_19286 [Folsomia candida]
MILNCKNWDDDGDSEFLTRVWIGIGEYYAWLVITPRKETSDRNHGHEHLYLYRILTLLTTYQNNGWCQPSMPLAIGGVIAADTVSHYILITSYDKIPLSILFLFVIIALDCVILIHVMFNMLGKPYTTSCDFIEFMKSRNGPKWVKRFMRSCHPSKLTMGDGTFFDRSTSLVIWQKGIDYLITLLLM